MRARAKVKASRDITDLVIAKLMKTRPRKIGDFGTFEVRRSTKSILTRVSHVIKTGIEPLDRLTGGICFGRLTEIYGLEASGKTALVRQCIVQAQKRDVYECIYGDDGEAMTLQRVGDDVTIVKVFIDNEHSTDQDATMKFADPADPTKEVEIDCILGDCDTVDQMFKIVDNTITAVSEASKEGNHKYLILIIVDTIAGTSSKEEMSMEWGTDDYSRQPKELRKGFRRLSRRLGRHNVCMICTNQVSESYKKKKSYGNSTTPQNGDFNTFGGKALKYFSSLRIFMYALDFKYVLVPKAKGAAGLLIGFYTSKNRRVKPLREGRIALLFGDEKSGYRGGLDSSFSILESLLFLGLAEFNKAAPNDIRFKFSKWGVPMTTFGSTVDQVGEDLAEEDDQGKKSTDPRIANRAQWITFYREHKVDLDALWEKAVEVSFSTEGLSPVDSDTIDEDDEDDDFPEDNEP